MTIRVVTLALAAGLSCAAAGQGSLAQETSPTLPLLRVRPSSVDGKTLEAKAREERLLRRMQDNDFLFRNICVHCGGGVNRAGSNAPFNPVQALAPGSRPPVEPEPGLQP